MKNITSDFGLTYQPTSALLIYKSPQGQQTYVESFDMDADGRPINPHPLSLKESLALSKALDTNDSSGDTFLKVDDLLSKNILHVKQGADGCAIWYTPARKMHLPFKEDLGIPCGEAHLPPLLWKADKDELYVFALASSRRPKPTSTLFHAPFFNLYEDGRVCMGTVQIKIPADATLEEFIDRWQSYFFNSYFSHLIGGNRIKGNIVQLWQGQINTDQKFPMQVLLPHRLNLNKLLP